MYPTKIMTDPSLVTKFPSAAIIFQGAINNEFINNESLSLSKDSSHF